MPLTPMNSPQNHFSEDITASYVHYHDRDSFLDKLLTSYSHSIWASVPYIELKDPFYIAQHTSTILSRTRSLLSMQIEGFMMIPHNAPPLPSITITGHNHIFLNCIKQLLQQNSLAEAIILLDIYATCAYNLNQKGSTANSQNPPSLLSQHQTFITFSQAFVFIIHHCQQYDIFLTYQDMNDTYTHILSKLITSSQNGIYNLNLHTLHNIQGSLLDFAVESINPEFQKSLFDNYFDFLTQQTISHISSLMSPSEPPECLTLRTPYTFPTQGDEFHKMWTYFVNNTPYEYSIKCFISSFSDYFQNFEQHLHSWQAQPLSQNSMPSVLPLVQFLIKTAEEVKATLPTQNFSLFFPLITLLTSGLEQLNFQMQQHPAYTKKLETYCLKLKNILFPSLTGTPVYF